MKENLSMKFKDGIKPSIVEKKNYLPPIIHQHLIKLEESICNGSAQLKIGTTANENAIRVETWDITTGWEEKQDINFDL